jgi:type III secretory pathway component EscT
VSKPNLFEHTKIIVYFIHQFKVSALIESAKNCPLNSRFPQFSQSVGFQHIAYKSQLQKTLILSFMFMVYFFKQSAADHKKMERQPGPHFLCAKNY